MGCGTSHPIHIIPTLHIGYDGIIKKANKEFLTMIDTKEDIVSKSISIFMPKKIYKLHINSIGRLKNDTEQKKNNFRHNMDVDLIYGDKIIFVGINVRILNDIIVATFESKSKKN